MPESRRSPSPCPPRHSTCSHSYAQTSIDDAANVPTSLQPGWAYRHGCMEVSHDKIFVSESWLVAIYIVNLQASVSVKSTSALIRKLIILWPLSGMYINVTLKMY